MNIKVFTDLAFIFSKNGFRLYMVGGTARDYLLSIPFFDFDVATDSTPNEMESFLLNGNFHYAHYGNVKLKIDSFSVDITTLREEAGYKDLRHPQSISFIKDISRDYLRRDFTINALYIDEKLQVYDFCGGQEDLKNRIIRMIGEPNLRLQEDPLRILRALRFKLKLGFEFEPSLERAIVNNIDMLDYIKPAKINEELAKIRVIDEPAATRLLMSYGIREHY